MPGFIFLYILLTACSKAHFGNDCNATCDECSLELYNRFNEICDIQDQCKTGWNGVKCDKGTCIILYKYSWKIGDCILIN
jgi:hypothetical protein